MSRKRVIVIGAGVGGLAAAARLAHIGYDVQVFEKTDQVGGRNRFEKVNECSFDGGPTLLMMLDPFRKLFSDLGENFDEKVEISLCDPSYRVFYRGSNPIDGTPNVARMIASLKDFCPHDAEKYPEFLGRLSQLYKDAIPHFVRNQYRTLGDHLHPKKLKLVIKHQMLRNLYKQVSRTFIDPRTRSLFSFQSMYLGLSPFDAPHVYSTLAYMEFGEGIWYPSGGLPQISHAIANLAQKYGVKIHLNQSVQLIDRNGIQLSDGRFVDADIIISNVDLPTTQRFLEKKPVKKPFRNSCSAYCLYLDYKGELNELLHHNVIFGEDYKGNFDSIFKSNSLPADPAFYCAISSKTESKRAPRGHSNVFLLIPVPNLKHSWTTEDEEILKDKVFNRLEELSSFQRKNIVSFKQRTPLDWHNELSLFEGAAFGISHDLFQSAFFRPKNKSKSQSNLYYVGASTAPGNGLPMVLISAELVSERIRREHKQPVPCLINSAINHNSSPP